jgi:hypothetical protein
MGVRSAIQLALAASTLLVIIHATPCHQGHQRRGMLPARAAVHTQAIYPGTVAAHAPGDARHQATFVRPTAFVPPVQFVARGRADSIAFAEAETVPTMRRSIGSASPECLMPRNSCGSSIEK